MDTKRFSVRTCKITKCLSLLFDVHSDPDTNSKKTAKNLMEIMHDANEEEMVDFYISIIALIRKETALGFLRRNIGNFWFIMNDNFTRSSPTIFRPK